MSVPAPTFAPKPASRCRTAVRYQIPPLTNPGARIAPVREGACTGTLRSNGRRGCNATANSSLRSPFCLAQCSRSIVAALIESNLAADFRCELEMAVPFHRRDHGRFASTIGAAFRRSGPTPSPYHQQSPQCVTHRRRSAVLGAVPIRCRTAQRVATASRACGDIPSRPQTHREFGRVLGHNCPGHTGPPLAYILARHASP